MATQEDVYRQIQERAQQFVNAGACKTLAQGIDLVLQQNPQLYEAYRSAAATPTITAPANPVHTMKAVQQEVQQEIMKRAAALVSKGATEQDAIRAVCKADPSLYAAYRDEQLTVNATVTSKTTPRRERAVKAFQEGAEAIRKSDEPLADAQQRFAETERGKYYYATVSGREPGPDPAEQATIALAKRALQVVVAMQAEVEAIAKENNITLPVRKSHTLPAHAMTFNEVRAFMKAA